jgi:energy-coupling factor transport system substrate-specific component
VAGHLVGNVLRLPVYLDSLGTVLVGVLAGPLAGAVTGILSNLVWGLALGAASSIPFAITAAVIGLLAGIFGRLGVFRTSGGAVAVLRVGLAGALTGLVAAIVSAPIAYFVFGGVTGGGTDILVVILREMTNSIFSAVLLQSAVVDPIDKAIVFLATWAILLAVPMSLKSLFAQGERAA